MIHLSLALSRIQTTVPTILPMTSHYSQNGLLSGKCFLTETLLNLHKNLIKKKVTPLIQIFFNDMSAVRASHQKHLGIYLDEKLNFKIHIKTVLCKVNREFL